MSEGTTNSKARSPRKRAHPACQTIATLNDKETKKSKKRVRNKRVRFSPKKKTHRADDYDRTPPELDVFDCDGCGIIIIGNRHHCKLCDFDLCSTCVPQVQHEHDEFEVITEEED